MTSTFSSAVTDRLTALSELADRYPLYVPVSAAAAPCLYRTGHLPLRYQLEAG